MLRRRPPADLLTRLYAAGEATAVFISSASTRRGLPFPGRMGWSARVGAGVGADGARASILTTIKVALALLNCCRNGRPPLSLFRSLAGVIVLLIQQLTRRLVGKEDAAGVYRGCLALSGVIAAAGVCVNCPA